jgi:hypothetical protein
MILELRFSSWDGSHNIKGVVLSPVSLFSPSLRPLLRWERGEGVNSSPEFPIYLSIKLI